MAHLNDNYKFFWSSAALGAFQCFPVNDAIVFKYERDNANKFIYRKTLETELSFQQDGKRFITDFDKLHALRDHRCDLVTLTIQEYCGGSWITIWTGFFTFSDCKVNVSQCRIDVKPKVLDDYDCIYKVWNDTKNILLIENKITAKYYYGEIEFYECPQQQSNTLTSFQSQYIAGATGTSLMYFVNCTPPNEGWVLYSSTVVRDTQGANTTYSVGSTYAREVVYGEPCVGGGYPSPPPGAGWVLIANNCPTSCDWARPVAVNYVNTTTGINTTTYLQTFYNFSIAGYNNGSAEFDNGVLVKDVIEYLFNDACDLELISNFFDVNPDGTNPQNSVYTTAIQELKYLTIWQKSDIKYWNATQNAVGSSQYGYGYMSFKTLLGILFNMFQVYWVIDNGKLRIEHESYFTKNRMLNLLQPQFSLCLEGTFAYTFNKSNLPKKERWRFMESFNDGFTESGYNYSNQCAEYDKMVEFEPEKTTTDIDFAAQYPDEISVDGWFMMVLDSNGTNYTIASEINLANNLNGFNAHLSWANLLYNYWRHDRPFINSDERPFFTQQKSLMQVPISLYLCCEDMQIFRAEDMVNTQLGWGEVAAASYKIPDKILKLDLQHD